MVKKIGHKTLGSKKKASIKEDEDKELRSSMSPHSSNLQIDS